MLFQRKFVNFIVYEKKKKMQNIVVFTHYNIEIIGEKKPSTTTTNPGTPLLGGNIHS